MSDNSIPKDETGASTSPASHHDQETSATKSVEYADQMKNEGNELFRASKWEEALAAYRVGLGSLPNRKVQSSKPREETSLDDEPDFLKEESGSEGGQFERGGKKNEEPRKSEEVEDVDSAESDPYAKSRAVLNANIAACFVKLGDDKEVVAACSEALRDDPQYIKALQRRATSNEKLNTWSSLASAQEDYRKLIELFPDPSTERANAQRKLAYLKPRVEEAQKKETAEMMGKLKGIGNSILGRFGLSTDNFQFVPNGQGGYSMNFQR
ncbi:TPR-like protein [Marasmius fiardii PR-910]|nr:TPR-like protein [Marasmius fiardii PR-910]